jgi:hypothetical protein
LGLPREFAYSAATRVTTAGLDSRVQCTGHFFRDFRDFGGEPCIDLTLDPDDALETIGFPLRPSATSPQSVQ